MNLAWFRFYAELNELLHRGRRNFSFPYSFNLSPSVKDAIEAMGIPHTEVDLILVNSEPVNFSYRLQNGDHVSVYPVFESFDISSVSCLRNRPLRNLKFLADVHLGKLAKYLRICGFDTYYQSNIRDNEIISLALKDNRIILTRDREMLKNKKVTHGHCIRSQRPFEQLKEIFKRFELKNQLLPFSRCIECNCILVDVSKEEISHRLLPGTRLFYHKFKKCTGCNRIYWAGSHYEKMKKLIDDLVNIQHIQEISDQHN